MCLRSAGSDAERAISLADGLNRPVDRRGLPGESFDHYSLKLLISFSVNLPTYSGLIADIKPLLT